MTSVSAARAHATPIGGLGPAAAAVVCALALGAGLGATLAPATTGVAAAALVIVAAFLWRVDLAVVGLVATAPIELVFDPGSSLSVTKVAGALCFASFGLYAVRSHRPLRFEPGQALVLGLLLLGLVSTLQARDMDAARATTLRYAAFVALYFVLAQLADDNRLLRRLAWTLSAASAAVAALALENYLTGETTVATFPSANPGDLAFVLATTMPLTFWLLGGTRRPLAPLVVAPMIALQAAAIMFSLSRGTLVGLAGGTLFLFLTERRRLRLVVGAAVVTALALVLVFRSDPDRLETALVLKEKVAQENVASRLDAWSAAARLVGDHPLLGVGPGNFRVHFLEVADRPPGTHNLAVAHNAYLDVAAELGVVGGLLFLAFLGLAFRRLTTAARSGVGPPGYAQALRVSLVIAAVCALFLSEQYFLPFWLIGGVAAALSADARRRRDDPEEGMAPDASADTDPGLDVHERRLRRRERKLVAQIAASRARRERLLRRHDALLARARTLAQGPHDAPAADLDADTHIDAVAARAEAIRQAAQELAARAVALDEREARVTPARPEREEFRDLRVAQRERRVAALELRLAALDRAIREDADDFHLRAAQLAAELDVRTERGSAALARELERQERALADAERNLRERESDLRERERSAPGDAPPEP